MGAFACYKALQCTVPDTTLVWQLSGAGFEHLRLRRIPRPRPGPEDIAFRVDGNSLCFSDTKVVRAGGAHPRLAGYDIARDKVVLGHEIAITVTEVGDRALPSMRLHARYIVQADLEKYGNAVGYGIWGGMIQYGVFDRRVQEYLIPVRKDIGYSMASLVEPWACIEASYVRCDLRAEDRSFWVLGGGGPMGRMHLARALLLRRQGLAPGLRCVIVTDPSAERREAVSARFAPLAARAGVALVCLDPDAPSHEAQMRAAAPDGADYCVACAPVPEVVLGARRFIARYGVLNVFAGLARGAGGVNLGDIHYDQQTITGNSGSRMEDMEKVLRRAEDGLLDTNESAAAVVGMREADKGLRAVADGAVTNKIVLYPQLPDLPLTRIAQLPDVAAFSEPVAGELREGRWSERAEAELFDACLRL